MISRRLLIIFTSLGFSGITALLVMLGCGGSSQVELMDRRGDSGYEPGVPNFEMQAVPGWHDDSSGIDLTLSIIQSSLIFIRTAKGYSASVVAEVQIFDQENRNLVAEDSWNDTTIVPTYEQTQLFETHLSRRHIPIAPGVYIIQVILRDINSDKRAVHHKQINVLDLTSKAVMLGQIQIETLRKGLASAPAMKFHIPSNFDSLRFILTLYNAPVSQKAVCEIMLRKFQHDTSVAITPYAFSPMSKPILFRQEL
jgi:hypothetical protein